MSVLLRHENRAFRDQVVYAAGHAFVNCTFERCTIVVREATGALERCTFTNCVWHLDVFVNDRDHWVQFQTLIGPILAASLPSAAHAQAVQVSRPAEPPRGS